MHDDPLPPEWVGKVWALEHGLRHARGEWVLGIDADTTPQPGLVAAAVNAAEQMGYDAVSFRAPLQRDDRRRAVAAAGDAGDAGLSLRCRRKRSCPIPIG